ncbi:DNA mismatch repair protein MutS [Bacillus sp. FSL K6-0046]|uniref:DNA mismatch repair protein MutS n=1 Tax=Bacillus TaxID=1386 RepID=UPI002169DA19|nr:DNA mismatch repair protein MutS [Bacillus sp. JUb11]MCS3484872.1 DNA mismatch repair protein MutS [Bacillus sp. JUb11]MDH3109919.1 DNA mismatch repair protein MutS [Bacillus altitudinis]
MASYTPMIQQYLKIKADYQDAFLFFRLGDFYEMFFDDAKEAAQELEITLTSRDGGTIPMCGVPYHSASAYIEQLIEKGYKVAICEQVEDPKTAKGVVKREVVQLITPGTVMDGKGLNENENNFIASVSSFQNGYGLALSDLSTGENMAAFIERLDEVVSEIYSVGAKEIVVSKKLDEETVKTLKERCQATISYEDSDELIDEAERLVSHLDEHLKIAFLTLYAYLRRTQKRSLDHLQQVQVFELEQTMKIDLYSKRNLELTETIRSKSKKGSLLWLLDETKTAMGGRLLKQWIDRPLIRLSQIKERQEMVQILMEHFFEREDLRERLKQVYDLERLAGRVAFGNVNARDLIQLKESLKQVPAIKELVHSLPEDMAKSRANDIDPCGDLLDLLEDALYENPPMTLKEGNLIKDGYNAKLDEYRDASRNGKDWIARLEQQEREYTGIRSLKVGFNKVFGYYIEVTRANTHLLEEGRYERKQTLANAERYITPELKEKEALILEAESNISELEYELFSALREQVKAYIPRLQLLAKQMSELDALQCFATVSEKRRYVRPEFSSDEVEVIDGRHPVVEKVMDHQEYVPNDCQMGKGRQTLLITGPNMSGKSTYMRQMALISILAQIGCFVPASKATLPIFDQIFTRIGAADDLISGQSTFMVEMLEAKNAMVHATKNSLILFDEIGRGTSTYDGMALAQAIIEFVHDHIGAKTLFSTHYHELTVLESQLSELKNVHVRAEEHEGTVVFLHQIKEGAADKSYGIHVAQLAELPDAIIDRAQTILTELESGSHEVIPRVSKAPKKEMAEEKQQLSFFEVEEKPQTKPVLKNKDQAVIEELKSFNLMDMTPLEAMTKLYELQKKL